MAVPKFRASLAYASAGPLPAACIKWTGSGSTSNSDRATVGECTDPHTINHLAFFLCSSLSAFNDTICTSLCKAGFMRFL